MISLCVFLRICFNYMRNLSPGSTAKLKDIMARIQDLVTSVEVLQLQDIEEAGFSGWKKPQGLLVWSHSAIPGRSDPEQE